MLLFCPFPSVAIFPVVIYLLLRNNSDNTDIRVTWYKSIWKRIKTAISLPNLVSILLAIIVGSFLASNNSSSILGILPINLETLMKFILYFTVEYGVFLPFILSTNKKRLCLIILLVVTIITSFIVMGTSYDFAWRTCIPLSFYIMLSVIKYLNDNKKRIKIVLIVVLIIGMLTPLSEFIRTAKNEYFVLKGDCSAKSDSLISVFEYDNNECRDNFISNGAGLFFEVFAKR